MKDITDALKDVVFCYSKEDKQGFVKKPQCSCYVKGRKDCKASYERERFLYEYEKLTKQGFSRAEIIQKFEDYYKDRESFWFKNNVKL